MPAAPQHRPGAASSDARRPGANPWRIDLRELGRRPGSMQELERTLPAPDGWQVEGPTPMVGIGGGSHEPGTVPMYAVDDIEVAVAAVTTAGGEAGEIERQPYGLSALCRDDQGLPFWLGQLG